MRRPALPPKATHCTALLSGVAADGFKIIPERFYAVCADDVPEPILELRDEFLSDREHLKPALGGLHELCSPVGRIGHTYDVTVGLEVLNQFGHGLLGHLRAVREHAHRGPGVVQVLEHRRVGGAHVAMPPVGEPGDDEVVDRHERLAHEDGEVGGTFAAGEDRDPP